MTAFITLVLFDMEGVLSHYDRAARVDHLAATAGCTADTVRHAIWGSGLEARAEVLAVVAVPVPARLGGHLDIPGVLSPGGVVSPGEEVRLGRVGHDQG